MRRWGLILMAALALVGFASAEGEMRIWRAIGGYKTRAAFVSYQGGMVTLRKEDGEEVSFRLERLYPPDRMEVIRLAGEHAHGSIPAGEIRKPEGRRDLTWEEIVRGDVWPEDMTDSEKRALLDLRRGWKHAETRFFIVHYQQVGYAKRVARMADYFYQYIAADLRGFEDRATGKSHIVVVRKPEAWREFISDARTAPTWSAAYVRGSVMFLYDTGDNEEGAETLAHEMSHLVLNRFFVRRPPLWLNEGLADWYGNFGWKAFKGRHVDPGDGLGEMAFPFRVKMLLDMNAYPKRREDVGRFYRTSQQLVGMLKLRKDQAAFVDFLQRITVKGDAPSEALEAVYGLGEVDALQRAFNAFLE